jgi:uncharacterized protein YbjT (DUF2867 family)
MYAVTGITGRVGGEVARTLLNGGHTVRAVVRDSSKGAAWTRLGCGVATAEMNNAAALTAAFKEVAGVFILLPPTFDPSPGFPEARATIAAMRKALETARPQKVVCLSTIGAQAKRKNLLTQLSLMEQSIGDLPMPVTFLRPAWFMENCRWDVDSARDRGVLASFLQPLDKPVPMVATGDVGRVAAELLIESWAGRKIVELEGPTRVTPVNIAEAFTEILGRPVRAESVPRETWEQFFQSQGMRYPESRMRMIDGFNEGWITFEGGRDQVRKGFITIQTVVKALVDEAKQPAAVGGA